MYSVSQDYIDKILSVGVKTRRIRGSIGSLAFTEDDILSGSFGYSETATASSDIKLGGVYIGQMSLTFLKSFADRVTRGSWKGKTITVSIGLKIGEDTWEDIPLKPYVIDEANHTAVGVEVKAYDVMKLFDKKFSISTTSGTIYDIASFACNTCGVTLGMTQAQIEALPNGTEQLGLYPSNDVDTFRDLISWCAVCVGGFATINRNGALEFRVWNDQPMVEIDKYNRFTGGQWSDFNTYYTGVSVVDIETEATKYYGTSVGDTGLTMNLGNNPLLQYGMPETKEIQCRAILTALQKFNYTPFKCTSLIDPFLDLGDVISFTGGLADAESICCVMKMDYKYSKGMTLQGYGKNPALFGAQSKADKNISGLLSKTSENEYVTLSYVNITDFSLGEDVLTRVVDFKFASVKPKPVAIFTEINLDVTATSQDGIVTCEAQYWLDGEPLTYKPTATWNNDGKHILSLMYFLTTLSGGASYSWEVRLKISGGTATIGIANARSIIQGQGLAEMHDWDGNIEITETIPSIFINGLSSQSILATMTQRFIDADSESFSGQVMAVVIDGVTVMDFNDTINLSLSIPDFWRRCGEGMYAGSGDGLTIGLL